MKSFESPLPPTLFVAKELATIFDEMNLRGDRGLVDTRQWVREGLVVPVGCIGRPSKTAAHVYSAPQVFLLGVLLKLAKVGTSERAVLGAVVAKLNEDLGGETLLDRVWHTATSDLLRTGWLARIDVTYLTRDDRVITVNVFDGDAPQQFWPDVPPGKFFGSIFLNLAEIAEDIARGIAKVLATVDEGKD